MLPISVLMGQKRDVSRVEGVKREGDKRGKDKARLMLQKVDRHLWVLRTFHIKTSRHSRWVKS